MISVLILTKNEAQDLPACLDSVAWCNDVHVFDSYSEDDTVEIAKAAGAKVTQRKFDGYATQRNAALNTLNYLHPWILILDADERIPAELVPELQSQVLKAPEGVNGFRIRRRDYFWNTWLKHSQMTPFYIRLVRKGKASYHREINEVLQVEGLIEDMGGYFKHYPFSKGIDHWVSKHNKYSSMEAKRWVEEHENGIDFSVRKALFGPDFSERRYHQKGLFYKVPGRPLIKLFYLAIWRGGFLDGYAGITYAVLQAIYEYFIVLKTKELLNNRPTKRSVRHTPEYQVSS
ncbi:glycosyltransferase involved in cell wall biosynthesis [Larkinella arboricola]|uniref:Glycosyltransferase involved in cell wall biosynthesis n=1 Tax=Larkinella arboricola TaxID=643671 RepID=A0A327WUI9_LARAB|nr:glycosyltransferase family 2 protein [Larkinella arboricola]RAJ96090.1 glycosyltransferase involved in cell wall biosynthesis [Larkinella arboricola]